VRRMGEWSPECRRVHVWSRKGVRLGTWFTAINRRRWVVWPTTSNVEQYEPGRAIGWHTRDSGAHWSFRLDPDGDGTAVVQRRELPHGITLAGRMLASTLLGGVEEHSEELREGMDTTLARIKAEAEAEPS
jgi:hypothetical protein